jgi:hypothetical protein
MRRVHSHPEVLLADCGESGLKYAGLAYEKHAEIGFAERRSVYRCEKREGDPIRSERQAARLARIDCVGSLKFPDGCI